MTLFVSTLCCDEVIVVGVWKKESTTRVSMGWDNAWDDVSSLFFV
jgi:hypothetical protein